MPSASANDIDINTILFSNSPENVHIALSESSWFSRSIPIIFPKRLCVPYYIFLSWIWITIFWYQKCVCEFVDFIIVFGSTIQLRLPCIPICYVCLAIETRISMVTLDTICLIKKIVLNDWIKFENKTF